MAEHTKLVVRHLPANLPEEIFWKTLDPWLQPITLPDKTVNPPKCVATFKSYVPGKVRQNKTKLDIPSRAYIQFSTPDQVLEFHQGYINQAFRDSHGNLTFPKVEFAPYQKVAGPPKKIDSRIGTVESDRDYQAFLETLAAPAPEQNPEASKTESGEEKVTQPQVTPLIEHLRNVRKAAQEANISTKQQRHAAATHSSGKSTTTPGSRSFAAPPQIMKRVDPSSAPQKSNASSSITRDEPPNATTSTSKESKRTKHSSPLPGSSSNPPTTSSTTPNASSNTVPKSRPNKPPKSKREERGEQGAFKTDPSVKHSTNTKNQQHPKKILQPPKSSITTDATPSASQEREGPKRSGGRGGGGVGRGGRGGGKFTPNNPSSTHASSSSHAQQQDNNNHSQPKSIDQPNKSEPSKSETAAARRRLGMALAGISSKPDRSNSSHSKIKDRPSSKS